MSERLVEKGEWYRVYYKDCPFWFCYDQIDDGNSWASALLNVVSIAVDGTFMFFWKRKNVIIEDHRVKIGGKKKTLEAQVVKFASIEGLEDALEQAYPKTVNKNKPAFAVKCSAELESAL